MTFKIGTFAAVLFPSLDCMLKKLTDKANSTGGYSTVLNTFRFLVYLTFLLNFRSSLVVFVNEGMFHAIASSQTSLLISFINELGIFLDPDSIFLTSI